MTYFGSGPMGKRHKPIKRKAATTQGPLSATVQAASDDGGERASDQQPMPQKD